MSKILARVRAFLAEEPAVTGWAVNGGLAMLAAYAFHLGHTRQAAAATIVTALAAVYGALRARPAHMQVVAGGLVTLITAGAAFGLHVQPRTEGLILAGASVALAFLFRQNITPVTKARASAAP